jgi:poly-gamma-glutamate synthesis protein (capsule biosynthesis protein)
MTRSPVPHVRAAARTLLRAGADLVAGHSAHVYHGVAGPVLFDLGDFIDDYAVDPDLRNDLTLLWVVTADDAGPVSARAVPLRIEHCRTGLASPEEARWLHRRLATACAEWGTEVSLTSGGLAVPLR